MTPIWIVSYWKWQNHAPVKVEDPRNQRCWSIWRKDRCNLLLFSENVESPCRWMAMDQILQELQTIAENKNNIYIYIYPCWCHKDSKNEWNHRPVSLNCIYPPFSTCQIPIGQIPAVWSCFGLRLLQLCLMLLSRLLVSWRNLEKNITGKIPAKFH